MEIFLNKMFLVGSTSVGLWEVSVSATSTVNISTSWCQLILLKANFLCKNEYWSCVNPSPFHSFIYEKSVSVILVRSTTLILLKATFLCINGPWSFANPTPFHLFICLVQREANCFQSHSYVYIVPDKRDLVIFLWLCDWKLQTFYTYWFSNSSS